jgi:hypothetical protein
MTHRTTTPRKRKITRTINTATAGAAIGPITPGCEVFGVNKGQFSLIDIIAHCLEATGPADVTISTWTAAGADMNFAYDLMRQDAIRSLRFIVDFSFPTRQPQYCAALRERFGDECLRVTKTHAKFVLIRNGEWNLVIRSSMNLNENRRLESFEISDDAGLADFLDSIVAELFETQPAGKGFSNRPYDNCVEFEQFGKGPDGAVDESAVLASTDAKKYFGDGPLDNDIRRAGLSFEKSGVVT